jgi:hypothetical protein
VAAGIFEGPHSKRKDRNSGFLSKVALSEKLTTVQWGYDADAMHFLRPQGTQTILAHASDLLADMNDMRETSEEKNRPIIFVGHSLGGLVIKQVRPAQNSVAELPLIMQRRCARPTNTTGEADVIIITAKHLLVRTVPGLSSSALLIVVLILQLGLRPRRVLPRPWDILRMRTLLHR